MAESPKRPADVSRADASRVARPAAPTGKTARAADSVPVAVGPFTVLPMQFGRYRIDKLLGKGMMGAVYLAHDTQLDRPVALKVARVSTAGSAKLIKRMETEAKAAAKIDHPLICKVHDFGEIDGIRFIAMQYIEGEDLKSYLKRAGRRREPAEAIRIILQIARALEAAHEKGVIHRDLKPENIMLNRKGEPVIMDFGLARLATGATNAGLTQGMILGTAAYMSPEQAIGKAEGIDHRSDLYALGVMLFEMLTGEWPFTGSAIELMGRKCVQEAPSPLSINPALPPRLAEVCHRMIAQKKEDRYANSAEVIAALEAIDLNPLGAGGIPPEMSTVASTIVVPEERSFNFVDRQAAAPSLISTSIRQKILRRNPSIPGILGALTIWWNSQSPPLRWSILGSAGIGSVLLAVVLFFQNGNALVKVEILAQDVEVTFQQETLTLADGAKQFKVKPGAQTLHITSGNVEFDTDKFTLKKGDNPAVTVELVKSEIVTKFGDQEIGRKSLSVSSANQANPNHQSTNTTKGGWHGWPADAPKPAISPFKADEAKQHQEAWAKYLKVPVEYANSIGMKFRLIPPGEFLMGSSAAEIEEAMKTVTEGNSDVRIEGPQHKVILTRPFYLGMHEVTQKQYVTVMGTNPSNFSSTGSFKDMAANFDTTTHPVDTVRWNDAAEFCARLSHKEGMKPFYLLADDVVISRPGTGYRLPTEAEWEFACRAGTTTKYWTGDNDADLVRAGWISLNSRGRSHAVGGLAANPFELYDTHGNLLEWVQDAWDPTYYGQFANEPGVDPAGPFAPVDAWRVMRGGVWRDPASHSRVSMRGKAGPRHLHEFDGFRVALPVDAVKEALQKPREIKSSWQDWPEDAPAPAIAPFNADQAKAYQTAWADYLKVPVDRTNSIGMKFILIPPGEFMMGSTAAEIEEECRTFGVEHHDAIRSQAPRHKVTLSRPIYLGVHEVTQKQYVAVMNTNPSHFSSTGGGKGAVANIDTQNHPVDSVSWNDALEFCARLSKREDLQPFQVPASDTGTTMEGTGYRLPTEAEWEFACRAGTMTNYWTGDNDEDLLVAGWVSSNSGGHTHTVGTLAANPFGLHDTHGNLLEWVQDAWDPLFYSQFATEPAMNPIGPIVPLGFRRVIRSSVWRDPAFFSRAAVRFHLEPTNTHDFNGFRVALPIDTSKN